MSALLEHRSRWPGRRLWALAALGAAAALALLAGGCSSVAYLAQSVGGHVSLVSASRPVADWLHDDQAPPALKERLALSQAMRDFAVTELHLPDNQSYRRYADLKRPAAVWNVVAAPELSLALKTWCFPVVGCVGYRGYYDKADAEAAAQPLREQGWELSVYPVPAYSTLGKTAFLGPWGADPLLNTFIAWPEAELARLIFHELAHQVVFAPGDTAFNESFATAVERLGSARWLALHGSPALQAQTAAADARRSQFRALTRRSREALAALYARSELPDAAKREAKARVMDELRAEHQRLKAGEWAGFAGYDAFFAQANNASLGMQGAYLDAVPAFEALFQQQGADFPRFYAAVAALAELPHPQRWQQLNAFRGRVEPAPTANAVSGDNPRP